MSRIRVQTYPISRHELETFLIEKHGLPEDIVITNIGRPVNQEAWAIVIQSSSFEEMGELDMSDTSRKIKLLEN